MGLSVCYRGRGNSESWHEFRLGSAEMSILERLAIDFPGNSLSRLLSVPDMGKPKTITCAEAQEMAKSIPKFMVEHRELFCVHGRRDGKDGARTVSYGSGRSGMRIGGEIYSMWGEAAGIDLFRLDKDQQTGQYKRTFVKRMSAGETVTLDDGERVEVVAKYCGKRLEDFVTSFAAFVEQYKSDTIEIMIA